MNQRLEFGWYLPSNGDTTCYGEPDSVAPGTPMFDRVTAAAEAAGFEYMLVPVAVPCWEAWITTPPWPASWRGTTAMAADASPSWGC